MIQFRCPKCDKLLRVDETQVGKVGKCPGCSGKIRLPSLKSNNSEEALTNTSRATQGSSTSVPQGRKRKVPDEEVEPSDDYEEEPELVQRGKKKSRSKSAGQFLGMDEFTAIIGLGGMALISVILALILPITALFALGFGIIMMGVGGVRFLVVAFQDSAAQGLLCLIVPFYSLYYLVANFDKEKYPFFLNLIGTITMIVSSASYVAPMLRKY